MKHIIIVTPTSNMFIGIGAYAKIKNDLFLKLGNDSRLLDISNTVEYECLVELITNYSGSQILHVILEFELNILNKNKLLNDLTRLFKKRNKNIHLAVMFHELWYKTNGPFPVRLLKNIYKKNVIQTFISEVRPEKVFTNSYYNQSRLEKVGVNATFKPIFSNIRITHFNKTKEEGLNWLSNKGLKYDDKNDYIGVIFGVVPTGWKYIKTIELLHEISIRNRKNMKLLYFGPYGSKPSFQKLKNKVETTCSLTNLGLLSEKEVCLAIASADFGFCTTPLVIASRSGSLAALLEAKLPVIISDHEKLKETNFDAIGLPENYFWDIARIKKEGIPVKAEHSINEQADYRLEVAKTILDSLQ